MKGSSQDPPSGYGVRAAPRFNLRVPVEYRFPGFRGEGTVWNVSASGARIEWATALVGSGTHVWLRFSFFPGSFATELEADVVRRTETGFAVQFRELGPSQLDMLRRALPAATEAPTFH